MNVSVLVDTNVLVDAYDRAAPQKQKQTLAAFDYLVVHGSGALSTQVLAEFFVAITRKIAVPLSIANAYTRFERRFQHRISERGCAFRKSFRAQLSDL